ncbi:dienelactone hydrolase family protein [Comamonas composti]|uniref:dienelactone hydrolase family protein n=1 Tax=Comamonas composti TaxID=408558 RepID=UPI000429286D|nr:dienelactone hydrolase family protein [Comamonas composti]
MSRFVSLPMADGAVVPAWVARPEGEPRGAIVVLQEIFGVNAHIRAVADGLAEQGYLSVAPALFERVEPGVDLGYEQADRVRGMALKNAAEALPGLGVQQEIRAALDHASALAPGVGLGLMGFCWGGLLAWRAACTMPGVAAAVCYYGGGMTRPEEAQRSPQCPVMAHFGRHDDHIPLAGVEAFARAQQQVQLHLYDAGHGFHCDARGSYDAASARLAQERSLAFFEKNL